MLKPQEITKAIIDYLEDGEAEYAIMINGKWGTGKTYLWKENIVPELNKVKKNNIYISLYGVKDIDKIEQKILYQLLGLKDNYNIKKSDVSSITADLIKFYDSLSKKVDFGKTNFKPITDLIFGTTSYFIFQALIRNANNYVLCFDDLERIDANVKINQILGYINQFVEHYRIKTVLICNEEEISDSNNYQVWKEKLIWYTYQISPSIDQIIDYFIKDYPNDIKGILREHKRIILDLINRNNFNNIRTLKVCLSNFKLVCQTLNNLNYKNTVYSIYQDLILFVFSITIEYKKGDLKQENSEMIKRWIFQGYDFTLYGNKDNKESQESKEPSYLSKFIDCYYMNSTIDNFKSLAIYEYITNGYFNKDVFKEEIDNFISRIETSEDLFLKNFRVLSNDDFSQIAKQYLKKIKHNEIKVPSFLLRLCQVLFYFSINKLIPETHVELSQLFEQSIKKLSNSQQLQYENLESFGNNYILNDPEYLQNNDEYKKIKNLIIDLNNTNQIKMHTQNWTKLINILSTNPDDFFTKVNPESIVPIFDKLDIFNTVKLHDILWKLSNYNLSKFISFIRYRYNFFNVKELLSEDKKGLQGLMNLIESSLQNNSAQNNNQALNCYLITELKDEIDKVIEKLT